MATYDHLTFDSNELKRRLNEICDKALDEAVKVITSNKYFEGGQIDKTSKHNDYDGYVEIYASDLKAWLVEYGTGKYMRQDNPYLQEYKNSEYYYNLRRFRGDAIVYRGKRRYTQLDYESGSGEITRVGSNPAGKQTGTDTRPDPFLEDLMKQAYEAFESAFASEMGAFTFGTSILKSSQTV